MTPRVQAAAKNWLPILIGLLSLLGAGVAAWSNLKSDVAVVNQRVTDHERQQTEQQRETNDTLREIRADIKQLLKDSK